MLPACQCKGKLLNVLQAGACFGDWGVVNNEPRAASCIAEGSVPVELLSINACECNHTQSQAVIHSHKQSKAAQENKVTSTASLLSSCLLLNAGCCGWIADNFKATLDQAMLTALSDSETAKAVKAPVMNTRDQIKSDSFTFITREERKQGLRGMLNDDRTKAKREIERIDQAAAAKFNLPSIVRKNVLASVRAKAMAGVAETGPLGSVGEVMVEVEAEVAAVDQPHISDE